MKMFFSHWWSAAARVEAEAGRLAMVSAGLAPTLEVLTDHPHTNVDNIIFAPLIYAGASALIRHDVAFPWLMPESHEGLHELEDKERFNGRLAMLACVGPILEGVLQS